MGKLYLLPFVRLETYYKDSQQAKQLDTAVLIGGRWLLTSDSGYSALQKADQCSSEHIVL